LAEFYKARRRNKQNTNRWRDSHTILIHRWHIIPYRPKKIHPKTSTHHKQLQQCRRIQNQLTKIVAFLYTKNEKIEKGYRKIIAFTIASKKWNTEE
jgi:hypothetical protein